MFESDFAQFFAFGFIIFKAAGTVKEAAPPPSIKDKGGVQKIKMEI